MHNSNWCLYSLSNTNISYHLYKNNTNLELIHSKGYIAGELNLHVTACDGP